MVVFVRAFLEQDVKRDALEVSCRGRGALAVLSVDAVGGPEQRGELFERDHLVCVFSDASAFLEAFGEGGFCGERLGQRDFGCARLDGRLRGLGGWRGFGCRRGFGSSVGAGRLGLRIGTSAVAGAGLAAGKNCEEKDECRDELLHVVSCG